MNKKTVASSFALGLAASLPTVSNAAPTTYQFTNQPPSQVTPVFPSITGSVSLDTSRFQSGLLDGSTGAGYYNDPAASMSFSNGMTSYNVTGGVNFVMFNSTYTEVDLYSRDYSVEFAALINGVYPVTPNTTNTILPSLDANSGHGFLTAPAFSSTMFTVPPASAPEPASLALLGLGATGLLSRKRFGRNTRRSVNTDGLQTVAQ